MSTSLTDKAYEAIVRNPGYVKQQEWADAFDGQLSDKAMDWALSYAEARYEAVDKHVDALDAKADDTIRYTAIAITVVAGMLGVLAKAGDGPALLVFVPPLVVALVSVCHAIAARYPRKMTTPPSIRFAMTWCEYTKDDARKAKERVAASMHLAVVGQQHIALRKANLVRRATTWLAAALASLVGALVILAYLKWAP